METISDNKDQASYGISSMVEADTMKGFHERKSGRPLPESRTLNIAPLSFDSVRLTAKKGAALVFTWLQSVTGILCIPPALVETSVKACDKSDILVRGQRALYLALSALNAREDYEMFYEMVGHPCEGCCWLQTVIDILYTPPALVANEVKAGDKSDISIRVQLALYLAPGALNAREGYEMIWEKMGYISMNCSVYILNISLLKVSGGDVVSYAKGNVSVVRPRRLSVVVVNLVPDAGKEVLDSSGWTCNCDNHLGAKVSEGSLNRESDECSGDSKLGVVLRPPLFWRTTNSTVHSLQNQKSESVMAISYIGWDMLSDGDQHSYCGKTWMPSALAGESQLYRQTRERDAMKSAGGYTFYLLFDNSSGVNLETLLSVQPTMDKPAPCGSLADHRFAYANSAVRDASDLVSLTREFCPTAIAPAFASENAGPVHILGANYQGHHASDTAGSSERGLVVEAEASWLQPYSSAKFPAASFPPSNSNLKNWHAIPPDKNLGSSDLHHGWASSGHFDPGPLNAPPNIFIQGTSAPIYIQSRGRASTHTSPPLIYGGMHVMATTSLARGDYHITTPIGGTSSGASM